MNNLSEIIAQFSAAMLEHDITPPTNIKPDGELHRFYISGHKKGTLDGAYKLHADGLRPAGYFQDFTKGLKINWKFNGEVKQFSPEERRQYAQEKRQKQEQQQREELAKHHNAANEAAHIWAKAVPTSEHPYLTKKRIQAHGTRLYTDCFAHYRRYKGCLVIPLLNSSMRLMSLQFISSDGDKRLFPGGQKKGCFWWIGAKTDKILIAEGFATAASLFQSTGYQTFISFDAGNLPSVAAIVRSKRPDATIVICGDNDESGRGQQAAEAAALACDGLVAMPPELGTDYNDWFIQLNQEGV